MDNEYLKMVLALPGEFFSGWEFNDGDQVYLTEEIDDYSPSDVHGLYTVFDRLLAHDGILDTENWLYVRAVDCKNGRPIPSQEHIQKMILDNQEKQTGNRYNDFALLNLFNKYINSNIFTYAPVTYSAVELWLQYAAWEIYNMKWDGEKWI
jgi:hypothetical protein